MSNTFNEHWSQNNLAEVSQLKLDEAKKFLNSTLRFTDQNQPISILDAGFGDGVHALAFSELIKTNKLQQNSRFSGVDISEKALELAQTRPLTNCELFVSDIAKMPFKDKTFDVVFSFGVLGYTTNPEESFREMCRVLKPKGVIALWMYPKQKNLVGYALSTIRKLIQYGGPGLANLIANFLVPFMYVLPSRSGLNLGNSTWKQCREVLLVTIAPQNLHFPEEKEIEDWFKKNNIKIIEEDITHPKTLVGRKIDE